MEYALLLRSEDDVENRLHVNYYSANIGQGIDSFILGVTCTAGALKAVSRGFEELLTSESLPYGSPHGLIDSVEATADGTEFFTAHPWAEGYIPATAQESQQELTQDAPQE